MSFRGKKRSTGGLEITHTKSFFCYAPFADMGVDGFMARGELEFSALGFIPRVSSARLESLACNFSEKKQK